jgi:ABC-type branched-subunit amino acid transport system substrate-binding protein
MRQKESALRRLAVYAIAVFAGALAVSSGFAADAIKIGFSMAQSGPLAGSGKSALRRRAQASS